MRPFGCHEMRIISGDRKRRVPGRSRELSQSFAACQSTASMLFRCPLGRCALTLVHCLLALPRLPTFGRVFMLRLDAPRSVSFCDGMTRRDFLHAGSLACLGFTLPAFFARQAAAAQTERDSDVNCIMLFLVGGQSHIDTFDPKPNAPAEVRGPFKPISTNVSGIEITEI